MFTIADLQKEMSETCAGECHLSFKKYNVYVGFGLMFFSTPELNIPTYGYNAVEITICKNGVFGFIMPASMDGFLWKEYFNNDGIIGKRIPLQKVCDIINFLEGNEELKKGDIHCQHCGKPNDFGSVQCWWCERRF
jgi:hypothetical protein